MHRRDIIKGAIALTSIPGLATAAIEPPKQQGSSNDAFKKPYTIITPEVAVDAKTVRLLFTYDCPFCRSYHNGLLQWGQTLPAPIRFVTTPILSSDSDNLLMAVYGRLLMERLAPAKLAQYDYATYALIQGDSDTGTPAVKKLAPLDVMRVIASASGVTPKALTEFANKHGASIEKQLPEHVDVIRRYNMTLTPSVAVAGKVLVTPDDAGGEPQKYLLLLNAMVSKSIQGGLNGL